jgi:hypothetical protein
MLIYDMFLFAAVCGRPVPAWALRRGQTELAVKQHSQHGMSLTGLRPEPSGNPSPSGVCRSAKGGL